MALAPPPPTSQHRLNPVHIEGNASVEVGVLAVGTLPNEEGVHGLEDAVTDQGAARVPLGRAGTGWSVTPDVATSGKVKLVAAQCQLVVTCFQCGILFKARGRQREMGHSGGGWAFTAPALSLDPWSELGGSERGPRSGRIPRPTKATGYDMSTPGCLWELRLFPNPC